MRLEPVYLNRHANKGTIRSLDWDFFRDIAQCWIGRRPAVNVVKMALEDGLMAEIEGPTHDS